MFCMYEEHFGKDDSGMCKYRCTCVQVYRYTCLRTGGGFGGCTCQCWGKGLESGESITSDEGVGLGANRRLRMA